MHLASKRIRLLIPPKLFAPTASVAAKGKCDCQQHWLYSDKSLVCLLFSARSVVGCCHRRWGTRFIITVAETLELMVSEAAGLLRKQS